jgi:hypothetical protein
MFTTRSLVYTRVVGLWQYKRSKPWLPSAAPPRVSPTRKRANFGFAHFGTLGPVILPVALAREKVLTMARLPGRSCPPSRSCTVNSGSFTNGRRKCPLPASVRADLRAHTSALMRLYYLTGNPRAALRQYADCVAMMAAEFVAAPSPVMLALREAITTNQLTHDRSPSKTGLPSLQTHHPRPKRTSMR